MTMKRYIAALTAAILLLSGCSQSSQPQGSFSKASSVPKQEPSSVSSSAAPQEPSSASDAENVTSGRESSPVEIIEAYSKEGSYTYGPGLTSEYSFHIPQIDADTPDAKAINDQIDSYYGGMARHNVEAAKEGTDFYCVSVAYETYRFKDVLTLVLSCEYIAGFREYSVYHYDTLDGSWMDTVGYLARCGVSEEAFLKAAGEAAVRACDEEYFAFRDEHVLEDDNPAYVARRSWTACSQNINLGLQVFMEDDGLLTAIIPVGSCTETDQVPRRLRLELENASHELSASHKEYLFAEMKDGVLTLRFENNAACAQMLEANGNPMVEYGAEYQVHGTYSNYIGIFCGENGTLAEPYVYLLTAENRVEYVDVAAGLKGGYFCSGGPLTRINSVVSFETGTYSDGTEYVLACRMDGEKVDLSSITEKSQAESKGDRFIGSWSTTIVYQTDGGGSYENLVWLDITGDDGVYLQSILADAELENRYVGSMWYLGSSEDGAVYHYCFWRDDTLEPAQEGVVSLFIETELDENGYYDTMLLCVKELGNAGLFSTVPGEVTTLWLTMG